MKKLYILLLSILTIASTNLDAATTHPEPTFVAVKLKAPTGDEGIVYTASKYDASIEIKLRNVTQKTWPSIFYPSCIEDAQYDMPYVEMANGNSVAPGAKDHSFLEIKSTGIAHIERVEFVAGAAAKTANLSCSASIDGVDYLGDYIIKGTYDPLRKPIQFIAPIDGDIIVCDPTYFYDVPESIEFDDFFGGSGPDYPQFREDAKYIRLNWSDLPWGGSINSKGDPVNLFAIKVYTNADKTVVGIENETKDSFDVSLINEKLTITENADVQIYSLQGKLIMSVQNIDNLELSDMIQGMYIVKAQSVDKKRTIVKKILK